METLLPLAALLTSIALLWTGMKQLDLSRPWKAAIWFLDVLILVVATIALGSIGLLLVAVASVLAILGWSIRLAARKEEQLLYAATQARATKEDVYDLYSRLRHSHRVFRVLDPLDLARLIRLLSERARSIPEIEDMAQPVAMLYVTHRPELPWLAESFDRLMRLQRKPASESMSVADILTVAAQQSAATFVDVVEAILAALSPYEELDSGAAA